MAKKLGKKGKKQLARLILGLSVLLGILVGFVLYLTWPMMTGTRVVLATRPVDPFDPFRGQYMTINYEINNIPSIEGAKEGDSVYVLLEKDEQDIWRSTGASFSKPEDLAIKGTVKSTYSGSMRVSYGIEQFFFEMGADVPTNNITVEVKIDAFGKSRIIQLLKDGKPIEISYKPISITS